MDDRSPAESHSTSPSSADGMEAVCRRFREQVEQVGPPPPVESFLQGWSGRERARLLAALLSIELAGRWTNGETASAEEYLSRFPELTEDSALVETLIAAECRARRDCGAPLQREQLIRRFPEHAAAIEEAIGEQPNVPASEREENVEDSHPSTLILSGDHQGSTGLVRPQRVGSEPAKDSSKADDELPRAIGKYRVKRRIGRGSYGEIYLCHDPDLQLSVAVKVPRRELLESRHNVAMFLHEARILASLNHPAIVRVLYFDRTDDGLCYIVSEFIEGQDLEARMQQARLGHRQAALLVARIAEGLHHAHGNGLVHRDVKPANILLDADGNPYITDFGLALREPDTERNSQYIGTPRYMSPEQARGEGHLVNGQSDVFSLGLVFYELLTGRRAFRGNTVSELLSRIKNERFEASPPRQIEDSVPRELERICLKAIAKRASERYTTALDFADDLRAWTSQLAGDDPAVSGGKSSEIVPVVPKGLRSFDAKDAAFFLRLMPGPYDRDGVPESIRFWKGLVEERDADRTFRVGLVYGPSGCGKSSAVKAGLLPLLADHVVPIYIEATAEETEQRLLVALRKKFPSLPTECDLVESMNRLRRGSALPGDGKLLIVLDQFEQWLQERGDYRDTQLLHSLRHCDGERIQCAVMVRDDFWMPVMRFMRDLEIPVVQNRNSVAVDLFDLPHARNVLMEFGRAYGRLPEERHHLSAEQSAFLDEALAELSQDGRIVPVHLSLFAEMVKAKPWTPAVLREVGGAEGIGLRFLEENISGPHAPPSHRLHQAAIRQVLGALVPKKGHALKGAMRTRTELLQASLEPASQKPVLQPPGSDPQADAHGSQKEFEEVLRLLDDLHLITPADPESSSFGESDSQVKRRAGERYYQLTHDFLVPPVREWLERRQRETRRGRAQLLLEQRAEEWAPTPSARLLPSLPECLQIALFAPRRRTPQQRSMLRRAHIHHGRRLLAGLSLALLIALLAIRFWPQPPGQYDLLETFGNDGASSEARIAAFDQLQLNDVHVFPRVVEIVGRSEDPRVIRHALGELAAVAGQDRRLADSGNPSPVRESLAMLTRDLLERSSQQVRSDAFRLYSRLEEPDTVIETVRVVAAQSDGPWLTAVADYIGSLPLDDMPEGRREEPLRQLIAVVQEDRIERVSAAIVRRLDRVPAAQLLNWVGQAWSSDVKRAVEEGLLPYYQRTRRRRVQEIGQTAEDRLAQSLDVSGDSIQTDSEIEFLIQAVGYAQSVSGHRYETAGQLVLTLLQRRDGLADPDILDSVIESFALLNAEGTLPLDPLRDVVEDDAMIRNPARWPALTAAIKAAGDMRDKESIPVLIEHARDPDGTRFVSLRLEAVDSLGRMLHDTELMKFAPQDRNTIKAALMELVRIGDSPADVAVAAVQHFAMSATPDDVTIFFPLIMRRVYSGAAIRAVQTVLVHFPDRADQVVREYIQWRTTNPQRDERAVDDPDHAIVGIRFYRDESTVVERVESAVAEALRRAQTDLPNKDERQYAAELLKQLQNMSGL